MNRVLTIGVLLLTHVVLVDSLVLAGVLCGGRGRLCGDDEQCCEHTMAIFNGDGAAAPPYLEGQCVPKSQKCGEFWCGNRHCESGFFGTPSVCCVQISPSGASQYVCAHSELNCPGNTQQLSIRNTPASRYPDGS
jgi:hypothetical protein